MAKEKSNKPVKEVKDEAPVEEVEEKPVEEVKVEEPVEVKVKRFKNNTRKGMKIKLVDGKNFKWITVKPGDVVTIPRKIALRNKLVEVK